MWLDRLQVVQQTVFYIIQVWAGAMFTSTRGGVYVIRHSLGQKLPGRVLRLRPIISHANAPCLLCNRGRLQASLNGFSRIQLLLPFACTLHVTDQFHCLLIAHKAYLKGSRSYSGSYDYSQEKKDYSRGYRICFFGLLEPVSMASQSNLGESHRVSGTSQSISAGLAANPHNPSSAAYLAYPVKHVVSSLYRRMTEPPDQPVNKLLDAPALTTRQSSVFTPTRRASPFQPPPLSALRLSFDLLDAQAESLLLTRSLAEEIRLLIPPRLQLVDSWRLAYNLQLHGSSLATLYEHCEHVLGALGSTRRGGFVLVIQDGSEAADAGSVFGAYLTDPPKPSQHYFGTGECFLWRASILPTLASIQARSTKAQPTSPPSEDLLALAGLPPPPSADTTHAQRTTTVRRERRRSSAATSPTSPRRPPSQRETLDSHTKLRPISPAPSGRSTPDRIRFKAFPYSGINDFMIYCQRDYLSVGGGDGHYGLWLDSDLENGISETCPTFGNEPLSDDGKKFDVLGVEVWYVGAT